MSETAAQVPSASTGAVTSPGVALAAARRAQNISIEDAARQLRLSVRQVQALEADAHDKLPAPVFVRGFIRNYARMLRMDADALLKDSDAMAPAPAKRVAVALTGGVPFPRARKSRRMPYFAFAALVLIAAIAWYEFYWSQRVDGAKNAALTPAPAALKPDADGPIPAAVANPAGVMPGAPAPIAPIAPPAIRGEGALNFTFAGPSWLEVRDASGQALVAQTQPGGSGRSVKGMPPFLLVVGNPQAVRLTYNGKPVDLAPHVVNTVARLKLE